MNKPIETIRGMVISGHGLGRRLGFPTINLAYDGELQGVFVGRIRIGDKMYSAALHIGKRPTIEEDSKTVEAHILGFDMDGPIEQEVEIEVIEKVRDTEKFEDTNVLKEEISNDVEKVKNWYNRHN